MSQILASFELARRYFGKKDVKITFPSDVLPFVRDISDKRQEHFVCLALNGANEVIGNRVVTVGLLNSNQVHPREVFSDPIVDRAAAIILVHNHPSGDTEPSQEDVAITKRLVEAGELLGIKIHDHVIVSKNGYTSMKERGGDLGGRMHAPMKQRYYRPVFRGMEIRKPNYEDMQKVKGVWSSLCDLPN
jgi:DNA repair protein RadC